MSQYPFPRAKTTKLAKALQDDLEPILTKAATDIAKQTERKLKARKVVKDDATPDEQAGDFVIELDLSVFNRVVDVASSPLEQAAADSAQIVLAQLGFSERGELVNQVDERAVLYAKERAAEMVGKKWVGGKLVDNPNAEWVITDSTRNEIRSIIERAFSGEIAANDVERAIKDAGAFSADRAKLIARTEIANANSIGSLNGYRALAEIGIDVKKEWLPDATACPVCLGNADDGPIGLDDVFSGGVSAPAQHPNCECSLIPVVTEPASANPSDD